MKALRLGLNEDIAISVEDKTSGGGGTSEHSGGTEEFDTILTVDDAPKLDIPQPVRSNSKTPSRTTKKSAPKTTPKTTESKKKQQNLKKLKKDAAAAEAAIEKLVRT